jgi:hypothetical protein
MTKILINQYSQNLNHIIQFGEKSYEQRLHYRFLILGQSEIPIIIYSKIKEYATL